MKFPGKDLAEKKKKKNDNENKIKPENNLIKIILRISNPSYNRIEKMRDRNTKVLINIRERD